MIKLSVNDTKALISPEVGGSLVSLVINGKTISRNLTDNLSDPLLLSGFAMVPFCNRIRDGEFSFFERKIKLAPNFGDSPHTLHGYAWKNPWEIKSHNELSLTLSFRNGGNDWPFPYEATLEYTLSQNELRVDLQVTNTGQEPMPIGIGFHPYFPRFANLKIQAQTKAVWQRDAQDLPTTLTKAPASLLDFTDNCHIGYGGWFEIFHGNEIWAVMESSPNCKYLHIYAPENADFFCAEPTTHAPNSFNRDFSGENILLPNESIAMWIKISVP